MIFTSESFALAQVLSAADSACYMAKEKGRNRVQLCHADDADLSSRKGEMEWVGRIRNALDQDRFCLYAQDIVPVAGSNIAGKHVELLVRMLDEDGKLISPSVNSLCARELRARGPMRDELVADDPSRLSGTWCPASRSAEKRT